MNICNLKMKMRASRKSDIEDIIKIYKNILEVGTSEAGYFTSDISILSMIVLEKIDMYYICEYNKKIVGFIRLEKQLNNDDLQFLQEYKDHHYLAAIAVDPNYFGYGIARYMVNFISTKYNWISLVNAAPVLNLASLMMHVKCGYYQIPLIFEDKSNYMVAAFTNKRVG